jgi:hypothetical protein
MNLFQAANGAATFLILSALVAGLAKKLDTISGSPDRFLLNSPAIILLGLFLVVFRIKTLLDDHKHCAERQQDNNPYRYAGFVLAFISWFFWALAAYSLLSTIRSSELLATSILISTLWVAVHVIEILIDPKRRNTEVLTSITRERWVWYERRVYVVLSCPHRMVPSCHRPRGARSLSRAPDAPGGRHCQQSLLSRPSRQRRGCRPR